MENRFKPFKDLVGLIEETQENPRQIKFHQFRNRECIRQCPQIKISPTACPKCGMKLGLVCSPYGFGFACGHCEYILLRQWKHGDDGLSFELVIEE